MRPTVCRALRTYPLEERAGELWLNLNPVGGQRPEKTLRLRVVSNRLVATFITELILEPISPEGVTFTPGDYLQLDIPATGNIAFKDFQLAEPFATTWREQGLLALVAVNPGSARRNNYSLASAAGGRELRFNIRHATPPPGKVFAPGIGSSYVFQFKAGDEVTAVGPSGDFHIKPTQREMVYIGGGAGMAPIRSHLMTLFGTQSTPRKVSYWYGARSRRELFYDDTFMAIAARHGNFTFHPALSEPQAGDAWTGHTGFIHEVVLSAYLAAHPNPRAIEFYLCGPPRMIDATTTTLAKLGVDPQQIAFDAFN